jgi:Holliday junction DNA helicase RuvA
MIAHLSGTLLSREPQRVVIDVNGVGYEVHVPLSTFYEVGEVGTSVQLRIHTHVREDTLQLFGFRSLQEKAAFEHLTSVSGVGPKLALTILSGMSVEELIPAIRQSNSARLCRIPGVGKKTAERLVVELRDKLARTAPDQPTPPVTGPASLQEDVVSALVNLGYPNALAVRAFQEVARETPAEGGMEVLIKAALQVLSRPKRG